MRGGYAPYFSPSTPPDSNVPDGKPFYYTPGETFTFPPPGYSIEIWDADENNTLNGYIPVKKGSRCPTAPTSTDIGCFEDVQFSGVPTVSKYIEDPVHIEVGVYVGHPEKLPACSKHWFPYSGDCAFEDDKYEGIKQMYRCSEYNPTLPGLDWHTKGGSTASAYPGNSDKKLHYPNTHPDAKNCWTKFGFPLASNKMNVTYEHVRDSNGILWTNRTRLTVQFKEDASLLYTNISNPQRIVCLTWKGMLGSTKHAEGEVESTRCWSIIFNVKPTLSVCRDQVDLPPVKSMCGKWSLFKTDGFSDDQKNGDKSEISIAVGQDLMSYIYFEDGNRDLTSNCTVCDKVKISVLANPGLPNNAILDATKGPSDVNMADNAPSREVPIRFNNMQSAASYFQYSRKLTFTPEKESAIKVSSSERNGLRYKVCFQATSETTPFYQNKVVMKSDVVCAFIQVVRPEPRLNTITQLQPGLGDEPLPMLSDLSEPGFSQANLPFIAKVRCPYKWKIDTYELKANHSRLQYESFEDAVVGYRQGQYVPTAKVDPSNPLPKGAMLAPGPNNHYQILSWSPERGMEGRNFTFCLIITDKHLDVGHYRRCTTIHVQKCQVCGLPSDTLHSISMEYKTDWLQLWGANYNISNPNHLGDYEALKLGPLYTTNKEEKISALASRFSMTPTTLIEVNPDLKGKSAVGSGTEVCLVPVICGAL